MDRLHIAYVLIALTAAFFGSVIAYWRHNSPEKTYRRRLVRERAAHVARMAARSLAQRTTPPVGDAR